MQGRGAPGPPRGQSPRPCGQLLPPAPAALAGPGSEGGGGGSGDRDKMTNESKWDEEALPSAMGGAACQGPASLSVTSSEGPPPSVGPALPLHPSLLSGPQLHTLFALLTSTLKLFFRRRGPARWARPPAPSLYCTGGSSRRAHTGLRCPRWSGVVSQSPLVFFGMCHLYQTSPSLKCCLNESL